jgi:hypothetical protein
MYANTLTLTINAVARTLLRKNQDNFGSFYSYVDGTEEITMKIRHDVENRQGTLVNRHNVLVEHTVYATPTTSEKFWSTTITLRDRKGSDPADLLKLWVGVSTLVLSIDDTLVAGDN